MSQSPSSSSFSAVQSTNFIETSNFKRCSWNLTYSSTLGVLLGVAPFFFSTVILNLSQLHHFHSHLKNFMDGLPEAMKIIVNQPFSFKAFLSNKAKKSQKICRLF